MKNLGLKRLVLIVALVIAAAAFSRGLILTFFYDIFDSCLNSIPGAEPSLVCEYGPQVLLNTLAGLLITALAFTYLYKMTSLVHRMMPVLMGISYIIIATASWRFLVGLSDNFLLSQGPQTLSEYLFVFYANQEPLLIGLLFGLSYNLFTSLSKTAIPEAGRRAPRWVPKKK
jgi:hypothetical protein